MPPAQPSGFRRVVFRGGPAGEPWKEQVFETRPLSSDLRLAADELGVVLCDRTAAVSGVLARPPEDLGEGADRIGVLAVGESSAPVDDFWSARTYFSLPPGSSPADLARALDSLFRVLEEKTLSLIHI